MASTERPAVLGGRPLLDTKLPITKPTMPPTAEIMGGLQQVLDSGMITTSASVARFERAAAEYLRVKHVVAVSACTSGLMLVMRALGLQGDVLLPSFTFLATGHAILWNGLRPRFVDIDEETFNIDAAAVARALTPETRAVLGVHIFGNPCDVDALNALAAARNVVVLYDAAHGLGSTSHGRPVGGFGLAEVFSLSPTKLVTAGEGGLVATNDDSLARLIRIGRDYGNPGTYDPEYLGLNARMGEFNALLGLASLARVEANVERRNQLAERYRKHLSGLRGLSFQRISAGCRTTFKDFAILVDADAFGVTRDQLAAALDAENVVTRKYFDPPMHRQTMYRAMATAALPVTERIARSVLCLPLFSHLEEEVVDRVCEAVGRIQAHAGDVAHAVTGRA